MTKHCLLILSCIGTLYAGITDTYYSNGLSIEVQAFLGYIDHTVTRTDITTNPADKTWLQYFQDRDNDRPNSYRVALTYSKPLLNFLALEAGVSVVNTDNDEYSRYFNNTFEYLTVNYIALPVQIGVSFSWRFFKKFGVFVSPALELSNQFFNYSYDATPPMSDEITKAEIKYQFNPAFVAKGGAEFIPWRIFGVSLLCTYRPYSAEAKDISVIPSTTFKEKITYPPFALGIKCSLYLQRKKP
jgi:hypothetical protein